MTSIHAKSRSCFVFPDGCGGWVVKMVMPDGQPLEYPLTLRAAAQLQRHMAEAITDLIDHPPPA